MSVTRVKTSVKRSKMARDFDCGGNCKKKFYKSCHFLNLRSRPRARRRYHCVICALHELRAMLIAQPVSLLKSTV